MQRQREELSLSDEIRDRLPREPASNQRPKVCQFTVVKRLLKAQIQPDAGLAQAVRQKHFSVQPRGIEPALRKALLRPRQNATNGPNFCESFCRHGRAAYQPKAVAQAKGPGKSKSPARTQAREHARHGAPRPSRHATVRRPQLAYAEPRARAPTENSRAWNQNVGIVIAR